MKSKQLSSRKPTVQNGFESAELFQSPKSFHMVPSQILYVDYTDNEDATRFISQNLDTLYAMFQEEDYTFVSLKDEVSTLTGTDLYTAKQVIRYCFPEFKRLNFESQGYYTRYLSSVSEMTSIADRYIKDIFQSSDYKEVVQPGLLRLVEYSKTIGAYIFEYKRFNLDDKKLWMTAIEEYIRELPVLSDEADFSLPQTPEELPPEETASAKPLYEFTETLNETMGDDLCLRTIISPEEEDDVHAWRSAPDPVSPPPPPRCCLPPPSPSPSPSPPPQLLSRPPRPRADLIVESAKIPDQIPPDNYERYECKRSFYIEEPKPKRELIEKMYALIDEDKHLGLYEGLMQELKQVIQQFFEQHNPDPVISPLKIDSGRILLPEYDLEIRMTTLPKVLYILFLLHPEGIRIKELPAYYPRLRAIYNNIQYRENMDASIRRLCNPLDDSVRQNMSRIRKAFTDKINPRYASHYYIFGERGEVRKIRIASNPDFVDIPQDIRNIANIPLSN